MLPSEDTKTLAGLLWESFSTYREVRHVEEDSANPYKPFYRVASLLASPAPEHFAVLGSRRRLEPSEAVQVVRLAHPWFERMLGTADGVDEFLRLYTLHCEMVHPDEWGQG